ncbi:MAG TPA: hypothetical protein VEK73_14730 [Xanthobacteraceae bacterium]|nr:hypothetical protein [Xanthobacteraceae bacterium]
MTFDETLNGLVFEAKSGRPYSVTRIDVLVDGWLVGFGRETAQRRSDLAEAFWSAAPASQRSDLIRKRILREVA